jgi:anti-sigma B factor antagonist
MQRQQRLGSMSGNSRSLFHGTIRDVKGVQVLFLAGEIDISVKAELAKILEKSVEDAHSSLIIDLTDIRYIDSSGFEVLIRTQKQLTSREIKLYLVTENPLIRRLFSVLKLDLFFTVCKSLEHAISTASQTV